MINKIPFVQRTSQLCPRRGWTPRHCPHATTDGQDYTTSTDSTPLYWLNISNNYMKLRIIPMNAYNGCIPVTVWMVQKYVGGCIFGKWVNIKGFSDKKKAVELKSLLDR